MLVGGLVAALGLVFAARLGRQLALAVVGLSFVTALASPTAYTLTTLGEGHTGSIVTAGPSVQGGRGGPGGGMGGGPGGPGGGMPGQQGQNNQQGGQNGNGRKDRVHHRMFSAAGAPTAAEAPATEEDNSTTDDPDYVPSDRPIGVQADPDVTISDNGDFVVAWKEAFVDGLDDVWARGFNFDGTTTSRLPVLRMNVVTGGGQGGAAVALAPNGRLSLTYSDDYDMNGFNEMRLRDAFANK